MLVVVGRKIVVDFRYLRQRVGARCVVGALDSQENFAVVVEHNVEVVAERAQPLSHLAKGLENNVEERNVYFRDL